MALLILKVADPCSKWSYTVSEPHQGSIPLGMFAFWKTSVCLIPAGVHTYQMKQSTQRNQMSGVIISSTAVKRGVDLNHLQNFFNFEWKGMLLLILELTAQHSELCSLSHSKVAIKEKPEGHSPLVYSSMQITASGLFSNIVWICFWFERTAKCMEKYQIAPHKGFFFNHSHQLINSWT